MKTETVGGYAKVKWRAMRQLLCHPIVAVATHWAFQSLLYMDPTERLFKLTLDAMLTLAGSTLLSAWLPRQIAWPTAFIVAHTLNFLFNGHLWGVLKHYGLVSYTPEVFRIYVKALGRRAQLEPAIQYVVICGSLSRQQWSASSDLDARIIRNPGFINGLRACWFLLRERSRALVARFPLDVYVLDDEVRLQQLNVEEPLIELVQLGGTHP
jgi:hypothetical protein